MKPNSTALTAVEQTSNARSHAIVSASQLLKKIDEFMNESSGHFVSSQTIENWVTETSDMNRP
jgi:hypothetical protein